MSKATASCLMTVYRFFILLHSLVVRFSDVDLRLLDLSMLTIELSNWFLSVSDWVSAELIRSLRTIMFVASLEILSVAYLFTAESLGILLFLFLAAYEMKSKKATDLRFRDPCEF